MTRYVVIIRTPEKKLQMREEWAVSAADAKTQQAITLANEYGDEEWRILDIRPDSIQG